LAAIAMEMAGIAADIYKIARGNAIITTSNFTPG
jgi:hypothetical protein